MSRLRLAALTATAILAQPLLGHSFAAGTIKIGHPWARETAPTQTVGGGFMTFTNTGKTADRLISAASPAAREVQIHTMTMDGGVMRMRQLAAGLTVPAGRTVALKPGGYHIMLIGLKAPLKLGALVPATLRFERAGAVKIALKVESVGYQGPAGGEHVGH